MAPRGRRAGGAGIPCHPGVSGERPSPGRGREWLSPRNRALGEQLGVGGGGSLQNPNEKTESVRVRKPHVGATRVGRSLRFLRG